MKRGNEMKLAQDIVVNTNETFGTLKFMTKKSERKVQEGRELTEEIQDRRYDVRSSKQRGVISIILPGDVAEKDFEFYEKVKLVNPRFDPYCIAVDFRTLDSGIRILADDIVSVGAVVKTEAPTASQPSNGQKNDAAKNDKPKNV